MNAEPTLLFVNDISYLQWVTPEYVSTNFREVFVDETRTDTFVCITEESVEVCKFYYPNANVIVNGVYCPESTLIYFV